MKGKKKILMSAFGVTIFAMVLVLMSDPAPDVERSDFAELGIKALAFLVMYRSFKGIWKLDTKSAED